MFLSNLMENPETPTLQTIQVQLSQIQKEMATKEELSAIRKEMATKEELKSIESRMATKEDIERLESNNESLFTSIKKDLDALQDDMSDVKQKVTSIETVSNSIFEMVNGQKDDLDDHGLRIHLLEDDMIRVKDRVGIPGTIQRVD